MVKKIDTNKSEIVLDKNDYKDMSEEEIKKKLTKFNKKYLYQLVKNEAKYKEYSKDKLVDLIYSSVFVNAA